MYSHYSGVKKNAVIYTHISFEGSEFAIKMKNRRSSFSLSLSLSLVRSARDMG